MNTENAVYFSGKDDIYGLFKKIINSSENYIWIQAYYFTDIRIADFLLSAGKRGVAVTVLADKNKLKSAAPSFDKVFFIFSYYTCVLD